MAYPTIIQSEPMTDIDYDILYDSFQRATPETAMIPQRFQIEEGYRLILQYRIDSMEDDEPHHYDQTEEMYAYRLAGEGWKLALAGPDHLLEIAKES
jgi:hypothetical protein